MTEERFIEKKCGRKSGFEVPEGYFRQFADDILCELDVQGLPRAGVSFSRRIPYRIVAVAASVAAVVISAGVYIASVSEPVGQEPCVLAGQPDSYTSDSLVDQAADYVVMDSDDFYAYMSNE